ncbi:MAG: helix-turn-helix transcriptional regulator [Rhizobiales bacterium]|nr:helix-turn-helix transcriptional regulator [Hyphomicrobiales bacterium]MBN9010428.1 helix-turn-helix transcriptional regulator [Hyphomicrobiales bacterium]
MDEGQAVQGFAALAQETRLAVLKLLVKAGPEGVAAGAIGSSLGMQPSRTSFHLAQLERAGLIVSRRESRSVIYSASYAQLTSLIQFLMEDCCAGDPRIVSGCAPIIAKCAC